MAKAQDNEFDSWLNDPVGRKQSLVCQTCAYGEEVREIIRKFMRARATGATTRSNRDLHDFLCDPKNGINYHLGDSALNTHMRRCERELYKQMRAGDLKTGLARGPSKIDAELEVTKKPNSKKQPRKKTPRKRTTRKPKGA